MKKIFAIMVIAAATFACSRKTIPQSEIIISNQEKQENKTEVTVTTTSNNETSAGKTIYTTRCGRCHALKPVDKYNTAEWENILKVMIPKAKLTDAEAKEVTAYVIVHSR